MKKKEVLDLDAFIQELTREDKKTLGQKTLKLVEEVGELSKVILPYEGAYATNHRFVVRERILEEIADVTLCTQSVLYSMGFTKEELEEELARKSKYWADLQARERKVTREKGKWSLPYEIHVTVEASTSDIEAFKRVCDFAGVKPILLDLHVEGKEPIKDLMTSSVYFGDNQGVAERMDEIVRTLLDGGFNVIRKKIETTPWHPAAPSSSHRAYPEEEGTVMPDGCYFECHIPVLCVKELEEELECLLEDTKAHKSKNIFKKYEDGLYTVMVTLRDYECTYEEFQHSVSNLVELIKYHEFEVSKEIIEFSLYDSKVSHDYDWLRK